VVNLSSRNVSFLLLASGTIQRCQRFYNCVKMRIGVRKLLTIPSLPSLPITAVDNESNNLGDIFDKHLEFEFDKEDVDATMTTMTEESTERR
jgi:hypothetical protein